MPDSQFKNLLYELRFSPDFPLMFNSGFFFFFFLIIVIGYNFIKAKEIKWRNIYLMVVSFFFYYKSSGAFLLLLIFTTLFDFHIAQRIAQAPSHKEKKSLLSISLITNLGLLGYFKYTNFIAASFAGMMHMEFTPLNIILPVGISFFTFQSMSYTIDVYHQKIKPLARYTDYAFYVSFFPQLVAGPIVRARDFIPQLFTRTLITNAMVGRGLFLIMCGLFKKMVISDYISINFVDRIFDSPSLYSGFENLLGIYAYALQIYCDFSGYSDMAIGLALLLGFHFNINFDSPYRAASITEFWRRWHISLSSWLKDYLYISLGGNRKGRIRTYINLLLTMLLGGLWHGASLQFILWGAWHGVLLALDKLRLERLHLQYPNPTLARLAKTAMILITFHLVCIGWVFFRADSLLTVQLIWTQLLSGVDFTLLPQFINGYTPVALLITIGYLLHFTPHTLTQRITHLFIRTPHWAKAVVLALFIFLLVQVRSSDILPFIYFQF